ncbi:family 43 glycosylhydrolase [Streptomyces racemochromogenes]|uniref:Family 43 glycosylhydrolase n=1 Tax=Streptomyces racemochromogenes TaxID=67353 RepID=A0ABW7PHL7_9ACTN
MRGGPWSRPQWLEGEGFDPSLFFDDGADGGTGRAWFTAARVVDEAAGRTEIWMRAYLPRERRLTGPEYVLWSGSRPGARWSEAPHLYRVDGTYLLLTAEGGTDVDHSVVAARADRVTGPYEGAPGNPVLPAAEGPVTCTGHADLVRTPDGDWRAVLLGVRPGSALGRETFLSRITWDDGWPVFSPVHHTDPRRPLHDGFTTLSPGWNTLRTPRARFWTTGDGLRLRLRPERLGERTTPSLLARPQEQPDCDVSTELRSTPAAPGEEAGLAVVLDDDTHLLLLRTAEGLGLRRGHEVLARVAVPRGPVLLGVRIRGFHHTFAHAVPGGAWQDLPAVEATFLTPLFTGVQLGLYATSNGRASTHHAHFTSFDITYPSREEPSGQPRP